MNSLSFQKFKKELTERRYGGPVKGVEYRKLSPTLKVAVNDVYSMIDNLDAGDNVAAQDAFKNALTDKIGQALDDKRMTVANDWLNAGDTLQATQDAAGLDQVGVEDTPEPVEIDQDQEGQDEQPVVSEV